MVTGFRLGVLVKPDADAAHKYAKRDGFALKCFPTELDDAGEVPSEVLNFDQLAAFLLTIGNNFEATRITKSKRREDWTHSAPIYCKHCNQERREQRASCRARAEPSFYVYARYQRGLQPEFMVVVRDLCPENDGKWQRTQDRNAGGLFELSIDCTAGVGRLNDPDEPYITDSQLLRKLGRWMLDIQVFGCGSKEWYLRSCLSETTYRRWRTQREHSKNLNELMDSLAGHKTVRLGAEDATSVLTYTYEGEERDVVSLTWIAPWAQRVWNLADYIQLDCSFRGTKPYAYCVPQAIIGNEAIPLGFIMTPSECNETYDWWFADLTNSDKRVTVHKQIILSDEGPALKHFGMNPIAAAIHFFCHRHLIEKFGSNGFIGALVQQALATECKEAYDELRPQLLADAQQLWAEGTVTQADYDKFVRFLSEDFPHGIWHRAGYGVARCSNHAESFHGQINRMIKGVRSLVRRLHVIRTYIKKRFDAYNESPRTQVRRTVNRLIGYKVSTETFCRNRDCRAYQSTMARRCRLSTFPCKHFALHWKNTELEREFRMNPLPKFAILVVSNHVHVEPQPLFSVQLTSRKFAAYRKKKRKHPAPREDVVDPYEEGIPPEAMTAALLQWRDAGMIKDYLSARTVIMGARYILDRRSEPPELPALSFWVIKDWMEFYDAVIARQTPEDARASIAVFTSYWWKWAKTTKDFQSEPQPFLDSLGTFGTREQRPEAREDRSRRLEDVITGNSPVSRRRRRAGFAGIASRTPPGNPPDRSSSPAAGQAEVHARADAPASPDTRNSSSNSGQPFSCPGSQHRFGQPASATFSVVTPVSRFPIPLPRSANTSLPEQSSPRVEPGESGFAEVHARADAPASPDTRNSSEPRGSPICTARAARSVFQAPAAVSAAAASPGGSSFSASVDQPRNRSDRDLQRAFTQRPNPRDNPAFAPSQRVAIPPVVPDTPVTPRFRFSQSSGRRSSPSRVSRANGGIDICHTLASMPTDLPDLLVGLPNFSRTCYLNACLQAFFHIAWFRNWFLAHDREHFTGVAQAYHTLQYCLTHPAEHRYIRGCLRDLASYFSGFPQDLEHDPHEWFAVFFNTLHRSLAGIPEDDNTYSLAEGSIVSELFIGLVRQKVTCLTADCGAVRWKTDPCHCVTLELPDPPGRRGTVSLARCLASFSEGDTLLGSNRWSCPACGDLVNASKQLFLLKLPQVLIIHLKRVTFARGVAGKIDTHVSFSFELDVSSEVQLPSDAPPVQYRLRAVIQHIGGVSDEGHYVAFVREDSKWYSCNDSDVRLVADGDVLGAQAYILFYERHEGTSAPH
jgi:ubiquitin C-terminal hydrolase